MATYTVESNAGRQDENVRGILLTFDPGALVAPTGEVALRFEVSNDSFLRIRASLTAPHGVRLEEQLCDTEILDARYRPEDRARRVRERTRLACLRLMERFTGRPASPWGILTGVRPSKVFRLLADRGFSPDEIRDRLGEVYALSPAKAELLCTVALSQQPLLHDKPGHIGVYIGIPFCPTRCAYCSFASYPLHTHGHHVVPFHEALVREIEAAADLAARLGLKVTSLYVGGGTPTALPPDRLEDILAHVRAGFGTGASGDFTVEAGRPDTYTRGHIDAMVRQGVSRISVNPQTMNQKTLGLLGRSHTVEQVYQAFHLARQAGFKVINMDIIAGLPGETPGDMERTLGAIEALSPENLTVHTLAIKRASLWRRQLGEMAFPEDRDVERMLDMAGAAAARMGMRPYYLYRQRFIKANLENLGYAVPGAESAYNIRMIEETQTVIGLGGGGVTRMVDPRSGVVTRLANPKCPATYAQGIEGLIARKVRSIEALFR